MKTSIIFLIGVLFMMSGCSNLSMNVQKSLARSAGDITATLILDIRNDKITTDQILTFANQVILTTNKCDQENITKEELIALIENKIDNDVLKQYVKKIVGAVPNNMNLTQTKKIIIAICTGLCVGASEWDEEDLK